ncbi:MULTISPECIES: ribose 5-phosphate isomerase A [Halobacterium]|uniref:Ribose-5-phosphate isomerase A n=5 Tax=Halobacterium salinarum TaxID=2242 RepID=RPIA_HALSA|nr:MULTISPECIES: ribose 5-phosphate isomerase A [Halobacterium]B0R7H0.1 RecName: Full=Ribose-5-phosphate isomerase A; AltName: Full=Phosphoriboisomerase A; Short=PRI [Halobacterium salinarum R1]Q9HN33.1 RecName: Full=Ribose-5-phosphate isomerase A; AltName: Full=Phosphoriboisomerase A; Short=PRI [Halobacterium salinarum NRC-1]AAG20388.1 ribose 5-phosphate isomerase [Halobacterium salinarum NRC-1]MBB6089686.1 ribose 5-phosphate isomerase A [Halobacterium salinarum]MCF2206544.1 ribose 5-phosphat
MKQAGGSAEQKRRAGEAAVAEEVTEGAVVGLGTGSTVAHAIRALGAEASDVSGVATSFESRRRAVDAGVTVTSLEAASVDVAIDGADQVADGVLVKGGGAAHTREKYVAASADRFVVVADPSKESDVVDVPVPVAVVPDAWPVVVDRVEALGGTATLRDAERKDGPVVTDTGSLVVDCDFGAIETPEAVAASLSAVPGVVEHGLFVGMADAVYVGTDDGVRVRDP